MIDSLMETGGDFAFEDDLIMANPKEILAQSVISVLRTFIGDNQVYPGEGTMIASRHGLTQSRKTGDIIKSDVEDGLINSGVVSRDLLEVDVLPTGATSILVRIAIDPDGIIFDEPVRVDFDYDVGTGEVEHLNGVIE